jgi:site-specific recombinase XerD
MSIYRDKPTGRWRFDFDVRIAGQRIRRRQLLPAGWTRAQADAFDRQESAALYAVATGIARPRHYIDEAVRRYTSDRLAELKAGANAAREINAMRDWWTGRAIDDLHRVCSEYASDQLGALAPATIKNRISYLRAACRWAWKRHGLADSDPGARVVAPTVRNARNVTVSRAQMVALARACRHRGVRALIRILYWTGMRVSEAQRAVRSGDVFVLADTKNATPRLVPMLPIITSASRVPMPRRSVVDYWWPLARDACGLEHVHLHDLRHSAASAMVDGGVDLGTVGAVLGHQSAATTKRYAHHGVQRLADALGKIKKRS